MLVYVPRVVTLPTTIRVVIPKAIRTTVLALGAVLRVELLRFVGESS